MLTFVEEDQKYLNERAEKAKQFLQIPCVARLTDYQNHQKIFKQKLSDLNSELDEVFERKESMKEEIRNLIDKALQSLICEKQEEEESSGPFV